MKPNVPVMLLFGVLLVLWTAAFVFVAGLAIDLGDGWREFSDALDPRGKPTSWWFWYCVLVLPPVASLSGLVLAYLGRWRAALTVIPVAVLIGAAGGEIAYLVDRGYWLFG